MPRVPKIDRPILLIVVFLVVIGFFIFLSASLGITARDSGRFSSLVLNQLLFGLVLGGIFAFITSKIKFTFWRQYAFWLFIISLFLTILVFIPGLGLEAGGAKRWLLLGPLSFQPSELLKITTILYMATWFSGVKNKVETLKYGLIPLGIVAGVVGIVLLLQPDTDTYVVLVSALVSMYFVAGGKWKHILSIVGIGLICLALLLTFRPYLKDRLLTFLDPTSDALGSGYQIQQSLIAIGSGGFHGRGFGQSLQKFNFLPEPIGDSIFAVYAEEFGFLGTLLLLALFVAFLWRGLKIAANSTDLFGGLVAIGIVILITVQSFTNIMAMLGLIPLSGLPLIFVSHGGSALFVTLSSVGILFNISRYQKNS
ncbi:cell division protein FtsW [Candidatus Nomurabacteria bacterium]|nr:cell division protein FtsW [Candidatus Nomurabacteria bacterium]